MHENETDYHGRHFSEVPRFVKYIAMAIFIPLGIAAFIFGGGWVVMSLWNWLMPGLFGLKLLTFWQAVGILVLAKILFGSGHWGKHHNHARKHWKWRGNWSHDDWAPNGDYRNWKYYEDYWKAEGKTAYEAYINKIKAEQK